MAHQAVAPVEQEELAVTPDQEMGGHMDARQISERRM